MASSTPGDARISYVKCVLQSVQRVQLLSFVTKDSSATGDGLKLKITVRDRSTSNELAWVKRARLNGEDTHDDVPSSLLVAGHEYSVCAQLLALQKAQDGQDAETASTAASDDDSDAATFDEKFRVLSSKTVEFRAGHTIEQMWQLLDKAKEFFERKGSWLPCTHFYRDKSQKYYDECKSYSHNGNLRHNLKNENGDAACPITGCIMGVHLAVSVDWRTGYLPTPSPYGNMRLCVPISSLYRDDFNLYFADFYCHAGSKSHHLQLVLTRLGSEADRFCRSRLPMLNPTRNFCFYEDRLTGEMTHNTGAWIHVFYTEAISVHDGSLHPVDCSSNSVKHGRPKDPACTYCNL